MADKKTIAVLGATVSQGGGLCRAILADSDGGFACRAITRDPSTDKAQELKSKGAEVVQADIDDVEHTGHGQRVRAVVIGRGVNKRRQSHERDQDRRDSETEAH